MLYYFPNGHNNAAVKRGGFLMTDRITPLGERAAARTANPALVQSPQDAERFDSNKMKARNRRDERVESGTSTTARGLDATAMSPRMR